MSESVESYGERLRAGTVDRPPGALPPHHPECFGCGPEAVQGLHLVPYRVGDEIRASYTFGREHAGAPGIAHGGLVASLLDDVCGFALFVIRAPAVTRRLEVDYRKPVLLGVEYSVVARIDTFEGRKLWVDAEGRDPAGVLTFSARGLFIVVDPSHFAQGQAGDQPTVAT